MTVSETDLYKILKKKIGEKEADSLIGFVKAEVNEKFESQKSYFASKEDVANSKADIIKWMFIFWVGQLAAVFAILEFLS